MTLIACYGNSPVDNMAACLRLQPDKLILLGNGDAMRQGVARYEAVLRGRGMAVSILQWDIRGKAYDELAHMLYDFLREETDCTIDLTGGDTQVILAVGAMLAGLTEQQRARICVQRQDAGNSTRLVCGNRLVGMGEPLSLTVQELIALHGGSIHADAWQPPEDATVDQIQPLWELATTEPRQWNKALGVLAEFESKSSDQNAVFLRYSRLQSIQGFAEKEKLVRWLLEEFEKRGVIENTSFRDTWRYRYTSPLLRYCTRRAGNILEVKTLLQARALEEKGKPYFDACLMGVTIDWDGVEYAPAERIPETRNEIDVVLMRGLTALFVSCKNGSIADEELYKLHTVATRFGGYRAKKLLVATDLDRRSVSANRAFIQRAWDMDIYLVTDAGEFAPPDWDGMFQTAML